MTSLDSSDFKCHYLVLCLSSRRYRHSFGWLEYPPNWLPMLHQGTWGCSLKHLIQETFDDSWYAKGNKNVSLLSCWLSDSTFLCFQACRENTYHKTQKRHLRYLLISLDKEGQPSFYFQGILLHRVSYHERLTGGPVTHLLVQLH